MSGIVGIINLDGAPIERPLLQQMTNYIAYRGPDAQDVWSAGHVGLGHTMLRTTFESQRERQPCSLDGQVWITADARVDDRASLVQKLQARGRDALESATDVELILHAYHVWGADCVQHLLGDFAFAIWDGRHQRLFCARDHFGVKLLYYAYVANCLVFSNTLNCLRMHQAVTDNLNELAIGDFLLFGFNQDIATTTFKDIQRLPPAHVLTCSEGAPRLNRYWSLSIDGQIIRYKRSSDYVDHFRELLRQAVGGRLRTDRVAIWMSGGLDSTTLAATACELRDKCSAAYDLRAYCMVYDRLIPDEERYYAGLVAQALDIPIDYLGADDYALFERWDDPGLRRPEPVEDPLLAKSIDLFKHPASSSRVVLDGEDPDTLLCPSSVIAMLRGMPFGEVIAAVGRYVLCHRRWPPLGLGLYAKVRRWWGKEPWPPPYPTWLNQDFAVRFDLRKRWAQGWNTKPASIRPLRCEVHRRLTHPIWPWFLEFLDSGVTGYPLEVRLPYIDLRLVQYLLAIPPLPWCANKELLRVAMRGTLPEAVCQRPKTPLAGHPYYELLRQPEAEWIDTFEPIPALAQYVDRKAIPQVAGGICEPDAAWLHLRPLSLNHWLWSLESVKLPPTQPQCAINLQKGVVS